MWTTHQTGRKVELRWYKVTGAFFDVNYDVYRDDDLIATFAADDEDSGEDGDSWTSNSNYQYYYDATAVPGASNTYKVVATLFDGYSLEKTTVPVAIPLPSAPRNIRVTMTNSTTNQLSWTNDRSFDSASRIHVYRNGVLLTSLNANASGAFATSYNDTGLDNLNQDYVYRLQTEYYPDCASEQSVPVEAVFPAVAPSISASSSVSQINLSWPSGSVFGLSCTYEIYRDGEKIQETTATSYVDTNLPSAELHHYAVNAVLSPKRRSGLSNAVSVNTKLPTDTPAAIISPRTSLTSPAWLEGESATANLPVLFSLDGEEERQAIVDGNTSWHLDAASGGGLPPGIPLDPNTPAALVMTYGEGTAATTVNEQITWLPLDIAAHVNGILPLAVRRGDSLLLTAGGTGGVAIDADGDGTMDWTGMAGGKYAHRYDEVGEYEIKAYSGGDEIGMVRLAVVGFDAGAAKTYLNTLHPAVIDAVVAPASELDRVFVAKTSLYGKLQLGVAKMKPDIHRLNLSFAGQAYDLGKIVARIRAPRGPVVTVKEIEGVGCYLHTDAYFPVIRRYAGGEYLLGATVKMIPIRGDASYIVSVNSHGLVFADNGLTSTTVTGNDFNANGLLNLYLIAPATFNINNASVNLTIRESE